MVNTFTDPDISALPWLLWGSISSLGSNGTSDRPKCPPLESLFVCLASAQTVQNNETCLDGSELSDEIVKVSGIEV